MRSIREIPWRLMAVAVVTLLLAGFTAAGCGDDDDEGGGGGGDKAADTLQKVGKGEGKLDLVAWAGYVEDGSTDPAADWVTPFEKKTGCQVSVKTGGTSDEMVQLMRTGQYDGVSASGDASARLVEGGDVDPVNVDLVPNYKDIVPALKGQPYNTFDGQEYGIPHGRGSNLLAYRTDVVKPAPKSWDVVFDEDSPYKGKVTAYDNPIYIADAALYLMEHEPGLRIEDPYELNDEQFDAAIDLLKKQRGIIGEYWSDALKQITAFGGKDTVLGTTWQYQVSTLQADKKPVEAVLPEEGATGWSDTWMISSESKHPNCMYKWMNHIVSPKANAQVAEWFGEAPANQKSCALTAVKDHCETYHADDEEFFDQIHYWKTPLSDCGNGNNDCKTYDEWVQGWTEVKG